MSNQQAHNLLPLTTQRLVLRRLTDSDTPALAAYHNDPEVARYQSWERCSLAEAHALINEYRHQPFGKPGEMAASCHCPAGTTNEAVGDIAMKLQGHDPRQAMIGFTVHARINATAIREIISGLFNYFFGVMKLHRVIADCDPRNHASWGLNGKLGNATRRTTGETYH